MYFDDFLESQNISYKLLKNSLLKGRLSHAYLIDANYCEDSYDFVLAFVKMILCNKHYSSYSSSKCGECMICHRIDQGNYLDIRVIESDSFVIKKEQLLELQSDFSKSSLEGKYRIYIIKECEKMNKQAANSLLKFLEEPVDGIIAILVTNQFSRVLSTIVSRCQIVHLRHQLVLENNSSFENLSMLCCGNGSAISDFINDDNNLTIMNTALNFVSYFEENGLDILIFLKKMWYNDVQVRDNYLYAFKVIVYFYYDILSYKLGNDYFVFCDHKDIISKIGDANSIDSIVKKLEIVQYGYDMVLSNLNVNLLLDDIVIRLGEVT